MPYIPLRGRNLAALAALSAILGSAPLAALAALWTRVAVETSYVELVRGLQLPWSITLYALLGLSPPLALLPVAVVLWLNQRYVDSLNRQLPTFFKGAADGVRAGMPLTRALEVSARAVGNPLGREMLEALAVTELGLSLEEAFNRLVQKIPEPVLRRAASLLVAAQRSGGRVADVLDSAAEMYGMLRSYEEERKAHMAPYVWVSYVALAVFLLTAAIITSVFVEPLHAVSIPGLLSPPPPQLFKAVFFLSAYIQAAVGGMVAGKISRGTVKAGIPHSTIMMMAVAVYFTLQELYLAPLLTPRL